MMPSLGSIFSANKAFQHYFNKLPNNRYIKAASFLACATLGYLVFDTIRAKQWDKKAKELNDYYPSKNPFSDIQQALKAQERFTLYPRAFCENLPQNGISPLLPAIVSHIALKKLNRSIAEIQSKVTAEQKDEYNTLVDYHNLEQLLRKKTISLMGAEVPIVDLFHLYRYFPSEMLEITQALCFEEKACFEETLLEAVTDFNIAIRSPKSTKGLDTLNSFVIPNYYPLTIFKSSEEFTLSPDSWNQVRKNLSLGTYLPDLSKASFELLGKYVKDKHNSMLTNDQNKNVLSPSFSTLLTLLCYFKADLIVYQEQFPLDILKEVMQVLSQNVKAPPTETFNRVNQILIDSQNYTQLIKNYIDECLIQGYISIVSSLQPITDTDSISELNNQDIQALFNEVEIASINIDVQAKVQLLKEYINRYQSLPEDAIKLQNEFEVIVKRFFCFQARYNSQLKEKKEASTLDHDLLLSALQDLKNRFSYAFSAIDCWMDYPTLELEGFTTNLSELDNKLKTNLSLEQRILHARHVLRGKFPTQVDMRNNPSVLLKQDEAQQKKTNLFYEILECFPGRVKLLSQRTIHHEDDL